MSSQIFHSSLTTDLRCKHRRLRPCSALTPPTFPTQNLSFTPLRSMSSNPHPLQKYNIPQAGGDGGDSVGHGGRSGGGGDGEMAMEFRVVTTEDSEFSDCSSTVGDLGFRPILSSRSRFSWRSWWESPLALSATWRPGRISASTSSISSSPHSSSDRS